MRRGSLQRSLRRQLVFSIVRSDVWHDPAYAELISADPLFSLTTFARQGVEQSAWSTLESADIYQVSSTRDELPAPFHVRAPLLHRCPRLLCVSANGAGFDTVDVPACTQAGVLVLNQAGANAQSVAEAALGFMIDLTHRVVESDRLLRRERGFTREQLMGHELAGKRVGIVGIGHVGRRVARLAAAFELEVWAHDPLLSADEIKARGAHPVSFDELIEGCDIVTVHCPRDPVTLGLFNADVFARMRKGGIFINAARGGIHDEAALLAALRSGHLSGAGLDVWDVEPPPLDSELLHHEKVIATYHSAGVTHEARRRMASWAADQLSGLVRGQTPPRMVNPEVWPRFQQRLAQLL
jgi:D-3-phosphoglycerate dehydrogenase